MTDVDYARFELLLESIQASVHVIAVGQAVLVDRFEACCDRIERRFEQVAIRIAAIDAKVTAIDVKLDRFAIDTLSRIERIETHIGLNGAPHPKERRQHGASKRRKAA